MELKNYNLHFIFFGSGSGTSSVVNNNYFPYAELANPHSQIIRIFYEAGVIGIYLFVIALIKPIRRLQMPYKMHNMALFSMLLLIGAYFAHRSAAIFIFYGIFVVVATDYSNKESENTNTSFNK